MGKFDYLTSQVVNRSNDYTVYACPLCGTDNTINSSECKYCRYSLVEYENVYFSHFGCYNEAIEFLKAKKYLSAYEKIIAFLQFYPKDIDAQRLRLYILFLLNDDAFVEKAEAYLQVNSDRWAAKLIDTPESISLNEFALKVKFDGKGIVVPFDKMVSAKQDERKKATAQIKELINKLYDIYAKIKLKKGKNPIHDEFKLFYEKIFTEYLIRNEMNVIDYLGVNFNELSEETKSIIGSVDTIENKKLPDGYIAKVFMPEIRYHSLILQRAKITVNTNKKPNKQEK